MNAVTDVGTHNRVDRTGGQLTGAERRSLLRPLARTHAVNAVGRPSVLARLNSGRNARVDPARLVPPSSALTKAAVGRAESLLTPALLNHSYAFCDEAARVPRGRAKFLRRYGAFDLAIRLAPFRG
jgi:hypothetical protein